MFKPADKKDAEKQNKTSTNQRNWIQNSATIRIVSSSRQRQTESQPSTFHQRLEKLVDAENVCTILDPLRQKIHRPASSTEADAIENLVLVYAAAQILRLDRDQWNQFCLSAQWGTNRNRPRTNSEDSDEALKFVLRYAVADSKASSLTKSLNGLLHPLWAEGVNAEQAFSLLTNKLDKTQRRSPFIWTVPNQPVARGLAAITHRTFVTVTAVVHRKTNGRTVFDVQELMTHEVLEPTLL